MVLVWSNALLRMQSRVVLKLSVAVTSASPSTILSRIAHPSFLMFTYPRGIQHRRFLLRTAQAQDVPTLLGCHLGSVSVPIRHGLLLNPLLGVTEDVAAPTFNCHVT